ncbi:MULTISPECIES: carboxymuconolactone decarboxylase family protein [Desulfosediminicola]|uniref:carboxymuconolactone decarboxylase family protein n=1 Tax=Desulfosediminicola TaxID=2886823 RepID=UPI0010ACD8D6|nr:carboxymuconolactone decarboxylase family protein [Desulfosediminicola ganghwensis]
MKDPIYPDRTQYEVSQCYPEVMSALKDLSTKVRNCGPLEEKTTHLIQLAAAAANGSEATVHSHARRAMRAGASSYEIYHALMLLLPICGYPITMEAISWCRDILEGECGE